MQAMELDLKKDVSRYYRPPSDRVEIVDIPRRGFIMIDGKGDPNSAGFQEGVQAIYSVGYNLKFSIKKSLGKVYQVMPLEGLWWMKGGGFDMSRRDEWFWTLMIMQPDFVTEAMFSKAVEEVRRKKKLAGLEKAKLEKFAEGLAVQTMHVGPYSTEPGTVRKMVEFESANGYAVVGKHHEIYLGDPRRSAPEKLKTILRHPVKKA